MLAVAGSKATLQLWDLCSDSAYRTAFADRVKSATGLDVVNRRKGRGQDGVLGLANDDESDESDEE